MVALPIYLDNHSTTRTDPLVAEQVLRAMTEQYGNAGSTSHLFGWDAQELVDQARRTVAAAIGASAREIVFTSGATESNNLALRGVCQRTRRKGDHLISVVTEHKAILDPLARLARQGFQVTLLPVAAQGEDPQNPAPGVGQIDLDQLREAISEQTALVSVMLANNEIGVLQPLREIGEICRAAGVLLHCDATQAVGKLPVDVEQLQVDLMSFSAHKLHGPKGVGALYVRRRQPRVRLESQIDGGGQEFGLRSGTLNVPGIVGFAHALSLCETAAADERPRLRQLRDRLWTRLRDTLPETQLNGPSLEDPAARLAHNLNCSFPRVDGEALMMSMRDVAVSSGSACTSTNPEPSHVLRALGLSDQRTRSSLRFGLGRFNTEAEIDLAVELIAEAVQRLRKLSSMANPQ